MARIPVPGPWRWVALLGFALIAPVTLPAGGAERRLPEVRRRQAGEPLLPASVRSLQTAPECRAPALAQVAADQPLRVLRSWSDAGGERWLQVEAASGPGLTPARRGWLAA
jgi:hypothetical protein